MTERHELSIAESVVRQCAPAEGERRAAAGGLAGWLRTLFGAGSQGRWVGLRRVPQRELRVVETLTIGAKKQLVLVSCGAERFLVGTGAEGVGTIVRVRSERSAEGVKAMPVQPQGWTR